MPDLLVNIDVEDLPRAERFYLSAFGLRVGRRFGDAGVELLGASSPIYLLHKPAGSPSTPAASGLPRRYDRHWTPVHLDLVVDDVAAAVARAVAAGAVVEVEPTDTAWGCIAQLADPFGHGFCVLQLVGAGYDAIATGRG